MSDSKTQQQWLATGDFLILRPEGGSRPMSTMGHAIGVVLSGAVSARGFRSCGIVNGDRVLYQVAAAIPLGDAFIVPHRAVYARQVQPVDAEFGVRLVPGSPPPQRSSLALHSTDRVRPGDSVTLQSEDRLQMPFIGEQLTVSPECAPYFEVCTPTLGQRFHGPMVSWMSAACFVPEAPNAPRWRTPQLRVGEYVQLVVRNTSDMPRAFRSVLTGIEGMFVDDDPGGSSIPWSP